MFSGKILKQISIQINEIKGIFFILSFTEIFEFDLTIVFLGFKMEKIVNNKAK